jgi:GT2 family glycosyltransferase
MNASLLITAFQRVDLLKWHLNQLRKQIIQYDYEIIVINDGVPDGTDVLVNQYKKWLNIRYLFTGQRNLNGNIIWRIPGFALNIAARQASGDCLIISCAEMFPIQQDIIDRLIYTVKRSNNFLSIPYGKDDDGSYKSYVDKMQGGINSVSNEYRALKVDLCTTYPFYMGVCRQHFIDIGGYDEDFIGSAWDDTDLSRRLVKYGLSYVNIDRHVVHLKHKRVHDRSRWNYNKELYDQREALIVRNKGREWGTLCQ